MKICVPYHQIRSGYTTAVMDQPTMHQHLNWPSTGANPINEFTTEGYISCAFPTLLPNGIADFLAPRQRMVTIGNYFKYLMLYHDNSFAKHTVYWESSAKEKVRESLTLA